LAGVQVIESFPIVDERGALQRLFCNQELGEVLAGRSIVQINRSLTKEVGCIRGLHFQWPPHAEAKLVRCLSGRIWDVAVDLRVGSPTFLQWHAVELSPENSRMLLIPEGFAHGFQALEPDSEVLYFHTAHYAPDAEAGFRWDDPTFAITWPLAVSSISSRDSSLPILTPDFIGILT
jgi:dTDP-4-dehydrorhamnose 3,5-epimerase